MLWYLSRPALWLLWPLHRLTQDWGWAVVLLTVPIQALWHLVGAWSGRYTERMRAIKPQLEALRQRHEGDKEAYQRAVVALHREADLNPLGGCLPALVMIPGAALVLVCLYAALRADPHLGQAPFYWVPALGAPDPRCRLPLLLFLLSLPKRTSARPAEGPVTDSWLKRALRRVATAAFLPAACTVLPAGMALYWVAGEALRWLLWPLYRLRARRRAAP